MIERLAREQLPYCITTTDLPFGRRYRGKVRDTYATDDGRLIIVATDRISAFDHVLHQPIPFKGQVLNQLAAHFFEETQALVPNHVISVPDPNVTVAHQCDVFPVEFVIRGYLAGHAWREYRAGKREICGNPLSDGLKQNSRLPQPILTPATKAAEGHDEDISRAEIVSRGIIPSDVLATLEVMAFKLFELGTEMAAGQGLILVDTKYEFGRTASGDLVVIDEIHTPDSSRFFYADTYDEYLQADKPQRQLSKEFVREWLMAQGFRGDEDQRIPDLPDDFRVEVAMRYVELFETLSGKTFVPETGANPHRRIQKRLAELLT